MRTERDGVWACDVSDVVGEGEGFTGVFVRGRRAVRAGCVGCYEVGSKFAGYSLFSFFFYEGGVLSS